mmetsp:Transcript_132320/g.240706  ORF Transcript_132320/g.240706 Transcript_132320/m.240706 type:complete len:229 (+) Transcript_132320:81-767(+)
MAVVLKRQQTNSAMDCPGGKRRRVSLEEVVHHFSSAGICQPILDMGMSIDSAPGPQANFTNPCQPEFTAGMVRQCIGDVTANCGNLCQPPLSTSAQMGENYWLTDPILPESFACPVSLDSLEFVVYEEGFLLAELPKFAAFSISSCQTALPEVQKIALNANGTAFLLSATWQLLKVVRASQCSLAGGEFIGQLDEPQQSDYSFANQMALIVAGDFACSLQRDYCVNLF